MKKITSVESIDKIMKVDVDSLLREQHDSLKKHTVDCLLMVADLINNEKYAEVEEYVGFSPAGDGYGCDNNYLDLFYYEDIGYTMQKLIELKKELNK